MIHQGIEHHEAIILLIRSKIVGSAFALARSVMEILVRGAWFTCCATPDQITKFRDQDKIDLTVGEMSDAIDTSQNIEYFHDLKQRAWGMLRACTIWILLLVQPYLAKNKHYEASKKIVALGEYLRPKQT